MSFLGQLNFGYPVTSHNIITDVPDNAVLPLSIGSSLQGNTLGVTFGDLKSQISSPSVIAVNGTTLYSTIPLAGPLVGPVSDIGNIAFGDKAGKDTQTNQSTFLGIESGAFATNASNSFFVGYYSGRNATNANASTFLGNGAGNNATNASYSNFIGQNAGSGATNAEHSNFLGYLAGAGGFGATYANFFGRYAGYQANAAFNGNFIGESAGYQATSGSNSNFIGSFAGYQATSANRSNFIGYETGFNATTAYDSNFIGYQAGMNSTGNNVNAFGYRANKGGSLSGQTVFSNVTLPSYLNRAAATTAITVPNGAVTGSTYLYYNQTTFAIEAVRL
jgi:hypothetical protein